MSEHAIQNGTGWLETIRELVDKLRKAREDDDQGAIESIEQEISEGPLSVEVRSGWYSPGADDKDISRKPAEYNILLSTGGPALRLIGELDDYGQPESARLEWQDWGTPWTRLDGVSMEDCDALLEYARCFYSGE